jgi:hypothetical protein
VLKLVIDNLDQQWFNEFHICAALSRLRSLGGCGTAADPRLHKMLASTEAMLPAMSARGLASVLHGCASQGVELSESWVEGYWRASRGKLAEFTPQGFSNTLWACGKLSLTPNDDWVKSFWAECVGKLAQFKPQELSNTLWACGTLSLTPPEAWRDRFWAESVERLAQFNPQALSNTMWACGQLLLSPPKSWQDRYWKCCEVSLPQFNEQALSNALYACCQLQLLQHPVAAKLWSAAMEKLSAPGRAPRDADLCLCQLYHVSKLAEAELPGSCFSFPDAALIERAKAAWHALQSGGSAQAATSFELQVSSCLTRLGVAHQRSFLCTDCEHTIDVAITAGGKRLAIEVDGPTHFLQAPQHTLDGSTQLRNRLLSAHGWTVVSVPHYEWNFLSDE